MDAESSWRGRALTALTVAVWLACALGATAQNDDEGTRREGTRATVEAIMAKPADWDGKAVLARGRIKSTDQDDDKGFFQIILEGGLRARLPRGPIEAKYAEMKVQCVNSSRGATIRLFHPEIKEARKNLFSAGDEIVLAGTVSLKSSNRIWLDSASIADYNWPKIAGHYHDKNGRCHDYGVQDGNPYTGHAGGVVRNDERGRNGARAGNEDLPKAGAAEIMAKPAEFNGKELRVSGHIQRLESGDERDSFVLFLDDGLRCRMRRAEVENQYAGFVYHGYTGSGSGVQTQWQMFVGRDGGAKLVRTEKVSGSRKRTQVEIFSKGDEIEINGTVNQVSANRILLENTAISSYRWPRVPGSN